MNKALKNKKVNVYGFQVLFVNNYNVYTCNISIDMVDKKDHPVIDGVHFSNYQRLIGKYKREKWVTAITFVTLDYMEYDRMKMQVGRFLKQHALNKVHSKYASYEEKAVQKPEYTYEEMSAADAAVQYSIGPDLDF